MRKFVIDARTLGRRPTGIGMYAARQSQRLMRENSGCRFVLVTDVKESEAIRDLEAMGAEVRVYGKRIFNSIGVVGYFRFLKRVIDEVCPDTFWQPNNLQPFRPKGVARVIVSMHDVYGLGWSWRYALWHLYYRFAFGRTLRNVTEIWFNSQQTEREVRAVGGDALAKLKGEVVYPITEVPPKDQIPDYPHQRPYFLYLGNIEYRKGADILIDAYRRYRDAARRRGMEPAPYQLVFAGVEKNVKVPRTEGIEVLGYVDETTKWSLMKSCAALVVPSRAEGYGMQVAEASAMGIKCIASDLPVFREIDANGRVSVPVGDAAALSLALASRDAGPKLKVIHVTNDVAAASGVGTFVRRINDELNQLGVDSSIVTDIADLSTIQPFNSSTLILHIHGMWLGLHHAAAKWAKAHGAKLVWSTHGMTAPWAMHHKWWKKRLAWFAYQKRDLKSAALVHSTSEQEVKWNERFGLKKQCLVPLGTDLPEGVVVGSCSCREEVKTLLFVGRVYPVKAIDRLIKAFALAKPNGWRLRIVGPDEGGHMAALKKIADSTLQLQLGTTTSLVEFVGPKYGAELEAEYANCDALALVSHTENFGATVVDAMAHGKPVITSTKTPWKIVVGESCSGRSGRCGWWVENEPEILAKAIEELMAMSDEERAAMGANGRQLVEARFTWSAVAQDMLKAYSLTPNP